MLDEKEHVHGNTFLHWFCIVILLGLLSGHAMYLLSTNPIHYYVVGGDIGRVEAWLKNHSDENDLEHLGRYLHPAILNDQGQMVEYLLEIGVDPNTYNTQGATPLHAAVERKNPAIVSMLLSHGANPHLKLWGNDALAEALYGRNSVPVIQAFMEQGVSIDLENIRMHWIVDPEVRDLVEALMNQSSQTEAK